LNGDWGTAEQTKGDDTMTVKSLFLAALLVALTGPAFADTPGECRDQFRAADLNDDGVLSSSEIGSTDDLAEGVAVGTTLRQYLNVCAD
jgi:hypothetical protein